MQAAEANRQLAEYLIRNGRTVNQVKPKRLSPYSPQHHIEEQINAIGKIYSRRRCYEDFDVLIILFSQNAYSIFWSFIPWSSDYVIWV